MEALRGGDEQEEREEGRRRHGSSLSGFAVLETSPQVAPRVANEALAVVGDRLRGGRVGVVVVPRSLQRA